MSDLSQPAARDFLPRFFATLVALTFVAHLVALQVRESIFGGGWLKNLVYVAWDERLGLAFALLLFTVASVGLWLLAWLKLLTLLGMPRRRALSLAAGAWVALLALDLAVRQQLASIFGDAFDLFEFSRGVGGVLAMFRNLWTWYHREILLGGGALIALFVAAVLLSSALRSERHTWWGVDRLSARSVQVTTALGCLAVLAFLTVLSQIWPETRVLLTGDTLVGLPFGALVSATTDFDGDGYSQFESPPDTAPWDPDQHPHALDTPKDGIDQDLLLGDLDLDGLPDEVLLELRARTHYDQAQFSRRLNVVLVILESVRYDSLRAEVRGVPVMPNLQSLVAQGALAPDGFQATAGFTTPSLSQLFWGNTFNPGSSLLDDFRDNGRKLGVVSGYNLEEEGFERNIGLDKVDFLFDSRADTELDARIDTTPARRLVPQIDAFLTQQAKNKAPFFLFVHFADSHFPYLQDNERVLGESSLSRGEMTAARRNELLEVYYNQVHHIDRGCGALMESLQRNGLRDNTVVFFMSDHGESLFDDGILLGHGTALTEVMTQGVMVVAGATQDVPEVFSHLDVRALVRSMLTKPPVVRPKVVRSPAQHVLHYLGSPTSPSKIGLTRAGEQVDYDFETARTRLDAGAWEPFDPTSTKQEAVKQLLLEWEAMQWLNRDNAGWQY
ncbi:MAG: hypothetical protein AUK47_19700 [Deltaproteobacteria bacterium CG2_30_63_29]|nr:MAG: hypothetical protein AUK47_19700 [Deltaproteobacteria bacterium CG2_30_63_29]